MICDKKQEEVSVDCHKLFKQTTIMSAINDLNINGLTIADAPVISGVDVITHTMSMERMSLDISTVKTTSIITGWMY